MAGTPDFAAWLSGAYPKANPTSLGILSLVAAYSSGYMAMKRATRVSSAQLLADSQMERFRALTYGSIALNTGCGASCSEDATYTGDAAYSSTAQITGCQPGYR